jgi:hypothetical protein
MDSCVQDKKNHHLLIVLSFLIIREVFEKQGFLVVGHTHKDIDGSFVYFSKKFRE